MRADDIVRIREPRFCRLARRIKRVYRGQNYTESAINLMDSL